MKSEKKIESRLAKKLTVQIKSKGDTTMTNRISSAARSSNRLASLGAGAAVLFITGAGSASAQTPLSNGVSLMTGAPPVASYNSVDVGSTVGGWWVTQMPMSLSYEGVGLSISFTGNAGLAQSRQTISNPTPGSNYFAAQVGGSATFQFSAGQRYFGFAWGSPDLGNQVQFYNGTSLLASINGSTLISAAGLTTHTVAGSYAGFNFSELAFDRVVVAATGSGGFEFGNVTFSSTAPDVAPIPLGGAGGIIVLLGAFALRRGRLWRAMDLCPGPRLRAS